MKILYLHQYFVTPSMSGGTRSYEMAKRLAAAGHEVHIITSWREPTDKTDWWTDQIDGVYIHWLPVPYSNNMGFARRIQAFIRFAVGCAQRAISLGGDLVFATSTPLTIALPAVATARRLKRPMVFEVRDLWPTLPIAIGALRSPVTIALAKWLERFAYRNAEQIIALSPGMADGIAAVGYDRSRIHVIPNSCDLELFRPDAATAQRFRAAHPELGAGPIILYAGTMGQINGVSYFAELAAHLARLRPDARCVVIGSGAEEQKVRDTAVRHEVLGKNFFLYPAMNKAELVGAFHAASVSLSLFIDLPEMQHNSANKFFDSLASGRAVAINYGGWQAALLETYKCGMDVGPEPEKAAEKLARLLDNDIIAEKMGRNALGLAREKFDRDKLAADLRDILEDVQRTATLAR